MTTIVCLAVVLIGPDTPISSRRAIWGSRIRRITVVLWGGRSSWLGRRAIIVGAILRVRIRIASRRILFESKERVLVRGSGVLGTTKEEEEEEEEQGRSRAPLHIANGSLDSDSQFQPPLSQRGFASADVAVTDADGNDEVGRVVDMYYHPSRQTEAERVGTTRMI